MQTQSTINALEMRALTSAELDEVNGGFLPVLAIGAWLAAGFVWGMVAGDYLAEQYYTP
jgi:lactobin A/cerein 7B family class IIb bacteriocin